MYEVIKIKAKGLYNTRDLGGIATEDGKEIVRGKLIRSGKLFKLPKKSRRTLAALGISKVVDLRVPIERQTRPDTHIASSENVWLPVTTTPTDMPMSAKTMLKTMKREGDRLRDEYGMNVDAYMTDVYRAILFTEEQQKRLRQVLRIIIEDDGCVVWHCSSGKDRSGICSMLVESLLGVSEEDIYKDYLISARFLKRRFLLNRIGIAILPVKRRVKAILLGLMTLKKIYLQTVIEEIKSRYGSVIGYCKAVLGITDDDITTLRKKYLTKPVK